MTSRKQADVVEDATVERVTDPQGQVRKMLESSIDGAIVIDQKGKVLFVNEAAQLLFARRAAEMVGQPFDYTVDVGGVCEINVARPDGNRFAEVRLAEIEWEGAGVFLATVRDISDQKRAVELERQLIHADRLASIGQLAAGVAHEINNPATFIQANCSVMKQDVAAVSTALGRIRRQMPAMVGPQAAETFETLLLQAGIAERLVEMGEMLEDSLTGIKRIASTVKELSSFARFESDKIEFIDPNALVKVACKMVANDLKHRGELVLKLHPMPELALDRARMTQVFVNLLVNASHALDDGKSNTVRVESRYSRGDIFITIEDTGCGIPEANLSQLFEPFFTTKPRELGTGLGLPLSAKTVRQHGGEITVKSEVGVGSSFTVRLPKDTGLLKRPRPAANRTPTGQIRVRARILVVDDEPMVRKALKRVLSVNHMVVEADDGHAALELMREYQDFDVVICDLMMPGMGGVELFQKVRALDRDLSERMVFLTGGAMSDESRAVVSGYRVIVLEKPVPTDTLLGLVDRLKRKPV